MTTVAWDGEHLVADRQTTCGSIRGSMVKLVQVSTNRYVAGSGDTVEIQQVINWLKGGGSSRSKPNINESSFFLLDTRKKVCYFMDHRLIAMECNIPSSIGSGCEFALGAMCAGKNAIEAVEIASKLDVFTGLGYDVISIKKTKGK